MYTFVLKACGSLFHNYLHSGVLKVLHTAGPWAPCLPVGSCVWLAYMSGTFPEAVPVHMCSCTSRLCMYVGVCFCICFSVCAHACVIVCVYVSKRAYIGTLHYWTCQCCKSPQRQKGGDERQRDARWGTMLTWLSHACPQRSARRPLWCLPDGHICLFP